MSTTGTTYCNLADRRRLQERRSSTEAENEEDTEPELAIDAASSPSNISTRGKLRLKSRRVRHTKFGRHARSPGKTDARRSLEAVVLQKPFVARTPGESTDPFKSLPQLANGETSLLTHHYNTVFVRTTTPPGQRKHWFRYALNDEALFHATLFISASHFSAIQRKPVVPSFFHHRGEVIRLINARLHSSSLAATTDGTIGAIACLLVTDSLAGHPERVKAHISGLQQLITARGGLKTLHPLVIELVGWVDLLASISLQEPPIYGSLRVPNLNLNLYYGRPSLSTTAYSNAFSTRLLNFTGAADASFLAGSIYWGLRNVTLERDIESEAHHRATGVQFSDRTEFLERALQHLIHDILPPPTSPNADSHDLVLPIRLFAYASLIYVGLILRDLLDNVLSRILAERLEFSMDIDDSELNVLLGTFPDMMLWVLFLGGGTAKLKSKVWFAKTAAKILRIQKVEDLDGIKAGATRFLWPEGKETYNPTRHEPVDI